MKLRVLSALLLFHFAVVASTCAQQNVPAPAKAFATAPEIVYDSVPNFLKLPTSVYLGEGIGVARNSKRHVFVYTRGGDTSHLYEFDQNGSFVREIGKGLYGFQMAHAVRVDPQDNIWVVDEGSSMIIKFDPEGHVVMTMEESLKPSTIQRAQRHLPRRAAAPEFQEIISTVLGRGPRCRRRYIRGGWLAKLEDRKIRQERHIHQVVGTRGPAPGQFNVPHSIVVDAKENIYVADRGN